MLSSNRTRSTTKQPSLLRRLLCCSSNSVSSNFSLTEPIARPATIETTPHRPYFISFECPWLPTKYPYDNHSDGFWDFPERAGWVLDGKRQYRTFPNPVADSLDPILKRLDNKYRCRQKTVRQRLLASRPADSVRIKAFRSDGRQSSLSDEVAFLQSWLFFGVYAQVNAITGVRSDPTSDFATETHTDGSKTLSTAVFDVLPHRWAAALSAPGEDRMGRWKQLLEVVQHAVTLQTIISHQKVNRELKPRTLTYDECKVLLSIRLLFRAILLALVLSISSPSPPDSSSSSLAPVVIPDATPDIAALDLILHPVLAQSFPADWDELKDFAIDEMRTHGWCPSECQLLHAFDGAYNFFAARLPPRTLVDHAHCTDWTCVADQVDDSRYETKHVEDGCGCASVRVAPEQLSAVLAREKVPRLVLSNDLKVSVSESEPYIAISHVWAHGLGNPKDNALPACQLQRLASYMSGLKATGETSVALWIDTLCIPVQENFKSLRKQAIRLMGQTYRDASAVLVLDKELQRLEISTV
ncbi:hypothetical protein C8R45DRAFT_430419 [Mycena sanguinolenta]|nr:hypothetical protein C8R45DRAFT_430419 [Mycena sanguinolenta]